MQEYIKRKKKKKIGSGHNTILIISNDKIQDIIKIVKYLEDSSLLLKGVTEAVQNEVNMLLGTLDASLLGNILTG